NLEIIERPLPWHQRVKKWWDSGLERESILGYVLLVPMLIVVLGLIGYPFALSVFYSFTNKLLAQPDYDVVGFENYSSLLNDPIFRKTLLNTFNYSVTAVLVKGVLGLIMALCLNEIIRMRRVIRAVFLLPWVAPSSLSILAWVWMFDSQFSIITYFLTQVGLVSQKIPWLGDPELAMAAVQTVNIWRGVPFFGMILLAGLVTVPKELYEAAIVDGANAWQRFWNVTLPHIFPILIVVTLFSFVITLGDFQIVWILTKGGPLNSTHLIATLAFRTAIRSADVARGAAIATFLFPFLVMVIALQVRYLRRSD
ncbi:MAG: sugar ABC transporter permease, partial [Chloroflexota bacterium]